MTPTDWAYLPFFLAVARMGNLRAGADQLNANHVTTRRNIEALEASLGSRLFTRSRKGFTLTEAGEALLPLAEAAEQNIIAARRRVDGLDRTERGSIRFSLPPVLAFDVIAPILSRFSKAYPQIDIDLHLTDQVEDIARAQADVSLRVAFDITDDVVARKLFPFYMATFAHRDYLAEHLPNAGPGGAGLDWIGWGGPGAGAGWLSNSPLPQANTRHATRDGYMQVTLARQAVGISRLPVIFSHIHPELVQVPGTPVEQAQTLWILLHSDLRRTLRVRRLVDFLTKELLALKPQMQQLAPAS